MLTADVLLYTRSMDEDYRWVYNNSFTVANELLLDSEYGEFEQNRTKYLEEYPLFVRDTKEGLTIYRFLKTENKDSAARPIYALVGCTFSGDDCFYVRRNLPEIICYFFLCFDAFLPVLDEISDDMRDEIHCIDFCTNKILSEYKKNTEFKTLDHFFIREYNKTNPKNFMFSAKKLKPIPDVIPVFPKKRRLFNSIVNFLKFPAKSEKTKNHGLFDYKNLFQNKTNRKQ